MGMAHDGEGALLVLREAGTTREWPLSDGLTIGRDATCSVCLPDRKVSRLHATLQRGSNGFLIVDHASKNGTWLNGTPVEAPMPLADGDEISIAARFKLYFVDADATAPLILEMRGLRLDLNAMMVYVNGQQLDPPLSGLQFELLRRLNLSPGQVAARDDIVDAVWPDAVSEGVSEDALDALVRRTRVRLLQADPEHDYIVNVRGYGYRFENR
jgi:DNA-binding response OmpR family regulator